MSENLNADLLSKRASILINKCDEVLYNAIDDLDKARTLVENHGLSVDSSILDPSFGCLDVTVLRTTGGHSNTDHIVKITGDHQKDRVEELKRFYQRRVKSSQPESRGEDRWDKPKIPGERRRRIAREKDLPQAPAEPPTSGYIAFVSQMTTKIRHDRPNEPHDQTKVIREISKIWKYRLDDGERDFYNEFAYRARREYQKLHDEYRATGRFQPAKVYERIEGTGPWVHKNSMEKNSLERELATYETVKFPLRPPELDEDYNRRQEESIRKRKLKLKAETEARGCRRRSTKSDKKQSGNSSSSSPVPSENSSNPEQEQNESGNSSIPEQREDSSNPEQVQNKSD